MKVNKGYLNSALNQVIISCRFASFSGAALYAKIAAKIGTKKIRDVGPRVKWMNVRYIYISLLLS